MVIERALEKLKQTQTATAVDRGSGARMYEGAERRAPRPAETPAAAPAPVVPRPNFKEFSCDPDRAVENRIMLPGTKFAADAALAAAYRMIRTRLQNLIATKSWTTLAVTSPEAGDGKSVTALNLALSFARDQSRNVFLIDLDMRNPSLCRYLGLQPEATLVSYFTGERSAAEVFFTVGIPNFVLAGNSESTEMASELLSGNRLEQLVDYIRSFAPNPLIIIDLPPVLVTDEALMIAPRVDATALVVADGQTRRDSVQRARQMLAEFSFAGVILNKSSEATAKSGYYYGYGYRKQ